MWDSSAYQILSLYQVPFGLVGVGSKSYSVSSVVAICTNSDTLLLSPPLLCFIFLFHRWRWLSTSIYPSSTKPKNPILRLISIESGGPVVSAKRVSLSTWWTVPKAEKIWTKLGSTSERLLISEQIGRYYNRKLEVHSKTVASASGFLTCHIFAPITDWTPTMSTSWKSWSNGKFAHRSSSSARR